MPSENGQLLGVRLRLVHGEGSGALLYVVLRAYSDGTYDLSLDVAGEA